VASIEVRGKEKLARVADVLTAHADGKALRNKMRRSIRGEASAITRDQKAALAAGLGHRGGLAAEATGESRLSVNTRLAGKSVGVTIVDSWKGHDMKGIDSGLIRHPLFGNRKHWFSTRVPRLMLTRPVLAHRRRIQRAIIVGLDELATEIAKET